MGLAPAPFNAWYFAWFALAPLWILIRQQKFTKQIALLALSWGIGYDGLALSWITGVHPLTWMGVPWLASLLIAIFCWIFITLWGTGIVVFWGIIIGFINQRISKKNLSDNLFLVLIATALWCGLETLWSHTPLWWPAIAYTQSPHNLAILQLNKLSGVNTVTAIIVAVNCLLGEAFLYWHNSNNFKNKFILLSSPLTIIIISHLGGYYLYQIPVSQDDLQPLKIGIVQGNIANEIKLFSRGWRKAIAGYTSGYQRLAKQGVDVVLTPETALPFYWQDILDNSSFYQAVIKEKVPAWVGANGRKAKSYTNSIFTLMGEGKTYSRYDKYKLVPLGEYIPFESILGKLIDRLSPLDAHLAAGKSNQIFDTPFGKAIIAICYESAFPQHFLRQAKAGGEFIITASNNAHYSTTMPAQHHALDVMRAIESDRWAARATNTGYSAIVDPHGNTLWISEIDRYAIHAHTIYRRQNKTLYVRWGDWLTPCLILFSLFSGIFFWVRQIDRLN
ncbi:apolipoprotein N-acyltransferase [Waterburya agarophytonicola K14]|uniref:Apolipoprotein N-acyltransferase n=2 Tax=Waterburya TaxID=2886915 RepID=A0A964FEI4_9CYAN|nr:apolipoprotein N-acyltransferase [Waterburya agarophytonicola KI4]